MDRVAMPKPNVVGLGGENHADLACWAMLDPKMGLVPPSNLANGCKVKLSTNCRHGIKWASHPIWTSIAAPFFDPLLTAPSIHH